MHAGAPEGGDFSDLPFGEQFLIWALRHWVRAYMTKCDVQATLHRGFYLAGIVEAYPVMDELLSIIAVSARTRIDVGCPHCAGISDDEQLFIALIAALQRNDAATSRRLLGYWLDASGVRLAQPPATRLAQLMLLGRLALRPRTVLRSTGGRQMAPARLPHEPSLEPPTVH